MAKKKQKQKRQSTQHTGKSAPQKTIESFAQAAYRERARTIKRDPELTGELLEGLDYDHLRQRRRIRASLAILEQVKARAASLCPDIQGVYSTEEEWIEINAFPSPAYDFEERYTFSALGCAIWILDQIRDNGKMKELETVLPLTEDLCEIEYPPIWDPCHGDEVIYNMLSAILHRNDPDDGAKVKPAAKHIIQRFYMTEELAEGEVSKHWQSRKRFDEILALIPEEMIQKAELLYQEKFWDFVDRYFRSRRVFCELDAKLKADVEAYEKRSMVTLSDLESTKKSSANLLGQANLFGPQAQISVTNQQSIASMQAEYQKLLRRVQGLEIESASLENREQQLCDSLDSFGKELWSFTSKPDSYIANKYGTEIADIWKDFRIGDPYAMCFGFLSLLDKGSDLPWCYCPGVNLHAFIAAELPWPRMKFHPLNDGIWNHYDPHTESIAFGPDDSILPKRIRIPESDDWHQLQYKDSCAEDQDDIELYNLSQILYETTGCLMPRRLDRYYPALKTLDRYGIRGKKALPYLYAISALGEARHRSSLSMLDRLFESFQTDSDQDEKENQSVDLLAQIQSLQQEVKRLKKAAYEAGREAQELKNSKEAAEQQALADAQELHDLRELVFNQQSDQFDDDEPSDDIRFPYRTGRRIIVFGGHDSWVRGMRPKLPDVRFVDRTMIPNLDMIRNADVVWIQTNALAHKHFYRIIDEVRKYNVPLRYFTCAGVNRCAEQIAKEDRQNMM